MGYKQDMAQEFAQHIRALGFRVFLATHRVTGATAEWGIITDAEGSRVMNFSMNDGGTLGGNYGPPSRESGTGWRMDEHPGDLKTADGVRRALYAYPPSWCGKGWKNLTTLVTHLGMYGASGYVEV